MIPLIRKTLRDKKWVLLAWAIGMIALVIMTVAFYPSFSESDAFDQVAKSLPAQFQSILGDAQSFKKLPNYIGQQIFDLRLPMFTIILAVVMAINLTATEEENGTLKTLQTLPISRVSVVLAKWISLGIITAVVCAAAIPAVWLGVLTIGHSIDIWPVVGAVCMLWLMTFGFASFTMMLGLGIGRKGIAVGIASLFAFYNIFLSTLAPSVARLKDVYKVSLYYYYNNPKLIITDINWAHVGILAAALVVFGLAAILLYQRRDIENA
jgi:ABC-2 type transport system permease protein